MSGVPPFASQQSDEYKVSLSGCPCTAGISGNWYFYPESQRQMTGMGFINNPLFTLPVVGINVTAKRAAVVVGAVLFARWMLKP